ncbi:MAG: DMT family transporter [Bacteroidales bacterium]|nr:DMT family transporter [Bacteroidales bacterium]
MWCLLTLLSAISLGFYDVLRKQSLRANAVPPVLLISTATSSVVLLPILLASANGLISPESSIYIAPITLHQHLLLVCKAAIVLSSWVFVYYGLKHLPLSIVSPIRATAPIWTLIGALIIFGERPNSIQWVGLVVTMVFFLLFSKAGAREGVNFKHNRWVFMVIIGTLIGSASALFDKHIIVSADIPRMSVLCYYSFYQVVMTIPLLFIMWWPNRKAEPIRFSWTIPAIGVIIILADFFYYGAIAAPDSLISLISPIRRSNVIISFLMAALIFHERNMLRKGLCLLGILAGISIIISGSI